MRLAILYPFSLSKSISFSSVSGLCLSSAAIASERIFLTSLVDTSSPLSVDKDSEKKYFNENQPFLIKGINISDVAVGTGIAAKELSFIINQHFKQRFNEFINQYRISYITKKINRTYLSNFTMEAIANEAMRLAIHKLPMKCRVVKREEA